MRDAVQHAGQDSRHDRARNPQNRHHHRGIYLDDAVVACCALRTCLGEQAAWCHPARCGCRTTHRTRRSSRASKKTSQNGHQQGGPLGAHLDDTVVARRAPRVWDEQAARDAARCAGDAVRHSGPDDHHERDAVVGEEAAPPAAAKAEAAAAAHHEGEVEQPKGKDLGDWVVAPKRWGKGGGLMRF